MLIVLLVKFKKKMIICKENGLITKIPILLSLCFTNEHCLIHLSGASSVLLWHSASERHSFKLQKRGSSGRPAAPPSASRQTHASNPKVRQANKKNYGYYGSILLDNYFWNLLTRAPIYDLRHKDIVTPAWAKSNWLVSQLLKASGFTP